MMESQISNKLQSIEENKDTNVIGKFSKNLYVPIKI